MPARRIRPGFLLALLLSGVTINYIDRGSVSVAAPLIARDFHLNQMQLGVLFAAFFVSYSIWQLPAGWLADRCDAKWIYAGGFLIWSAATAATGFVQSFGALILLRIMLGIGESVNYPACSNFLARHFAENERGFANGLVDAGSKIGPALSTSLGGLAASRYGWRWLFLGAGLGSLAWLIPWALAVPGRAAPGAGSAANATPAAANPIQIRESASGPSLWQIAQRPEAWGTSLGMFALGYVWYFLLSWLPWYFVNVRGFSMQTMALMGSLPFWGMALTSIAGGWASDQLIRRGFSPTRVRKSFVAAGLLLCAVFMFPAALVRSPTRSLWLLVASSLSLGIFTSNVWAITQTLAGPLASGKWAGIQNCIGNLGGVVSPIVAGWIVTATHSFIMAFAGASVILLAAIFAYWMIVGEVAPVAWELTRLSGTGDARQGNKENEGISANP